jgi:site-specific DNA recombinase
MARPAKLIRCAVYTRKSTDEGLDKEFTSLDAQREAGRAFVKSQAPLGWTCLSTRYDDGGFTGGNMDRPALKRLLADVASGSIDCVVVYKVDRLSRSLLDFARMMETFDQHHVAFVSVTQQFNTATSMGRLVLNVLLSFAQFEREIISERTRDKIAAARRKGKWAGGHPVLGYDIDPRGFKLIVNQAEATRVREIFQLYRHCQGLIRVVQELERRDWKNKRWLTRKGRDRGGKRFTKTSLHHLLTNVVYRGKVKYKKEVHAGEHEAIVDARLWQEVQRLLGRRSDGSGERSDSAALLKGLLYCRPCGRRMTPTYACKNGGIRYGYYVCTNALQRGRKACPSGSLPHTAIEHWVVEQTHKFAQESATAEQDGTFSQWELLGRNAQARLLRAWVARVDYDGAAGKAAITFRAPEQHGLGPTNGECS